MSGPTVAAVDIGTNSVLLLVASLRGDRLERRYESCQITRLGQGVAASGALDDGAVARTIVAVEAIAAVIARLDVARVGAIGTAVLRRVSNGRRFTDRAAQLLGCPVEVVSGRREAELVRGGVIGALGPQPAGTVIFDVGGGSTELVLLAAGATLELQSLELGAVRLSERMLQADPPAADEIAMAREEVAERLASLPGAFRARPGQAPLIGVAGTVTTLATVELGLAEYDTERVNGLILARGLIGQQIRRYAALDLAARRAMVGLEPGRADVILGGALIVDGILEHFGAERLRVCDRGVRWGLARELVCAAGG